MRILARAQELGKEAGVAAPEIFTLVAFMKEVKSKFADRLEHQEPIVDLMQEAFVDQRLERVKVWSDHLFRRRERAAADENGETGKEPLFLRTKQFVAPLRRGAQGPLPLRGIARAASQERQPLLKACEQRLW
jgi:hypothetical protein